MTITKHQQILEYIAGLEIGDKVSVRQLAKELDVSEGTAYRAIKEAESEGLVSSIPKVGTIRIAQKEERLIEDLTIKELEQIVEAVVLTGKDNLNWTPTKFVIGAMSESNIERHIEEHTLFIVGDRTELQMQAVTRGAALLITGGLAPCHDVVQAAEMRDIPILVSAYDTFAVTSIINRSIHNRLTEKELILVEDIMVKKVYYLHETDLVADWYNMAQASSHSRFPVVDSNMKVLGVVSAIDVAGASHHNPITSVMTANVLTTEKDTSVTHLSRIMVWEGVEMVPVVELDKLIGIVSRKDIIEAFQVIQKQPHFGETVDNMIISGFRLDWQEENKIQISGKATQFMSNEFGSVSIGNLVTIMNSAAYILTRKLHRVDMLTENFTLYHFEPVGVGLQIRARAHIIHMDKKTCKIDAEIYVDDSIVAKGLITTRLAKK